MHKLAITDHMLPADCMEVEPGDFGGLLFSMGGAQTFMGDNVIQSCNVSKEDCGRLARILLHYSQTGEFKDVP